MASKEEEETMDDLVKSNLDEKKSYFIHRSSIFQVIPVHLDFPAHKVSSIRSCIVI